MILNVDMAVLAFVVNRFILQQSIDKYQLNELSIRLFECFLDQKWLLELNPSILHVPIITYIIDAFPAIPEHTIPSRKASKIYPALGVLPSPVLCPTTQLHPLLDKERSIVDDDVFSSAYLKK